MKVLVTGGAGYVGSHTVRELLSAGHDVVVYDNLSTGHRELVEGVPLVVADIADHSTLLRALRDVDAVMHFAGSAYVGESIADPRKYFRNNVEYGLKFVDAVLASGVRRLVFSSSCAIYGVPSQLPIVESSAKSPINPYGATKLFLEQVLSAYQHSHGLQHVCLRYFNAGGAHANGDIGEYHEPETHLIPLAFKAIQAKRPALKVFGKDLPTPDGTCIRDFVHVTDLGRAHVKALEYLLRGGDSVALNLGTGKGTSIANLLATIEQVTGCAVPFELTAGRKGDPPVLYADSSRAQQLLGWTPEFDLAHILRSSWSWETEGLPRFLPSASRR
jgi:UDP-arabinose 4-epimerase